MQLPYQIGECESRRQLWFTTSMICCRTSPKQTPRASLSLATGRSRVSQDRNRSDRRRFSFGPCCVPARRMRLFLNTMYRENKRNNLTVYCVQTHHIPISEVESDMAPCKQLYTFYKSWTCLVVLDWSLGQSSSPWFLKCILLQFVNFTKKQNFNRRYTFT